MGGTIPTPYVAVQCSGYRGEVPKAALLVLNVADLCGKLLYVVT